MSMKLPVETAATLTAARSLQRSPVASRTLGVLRRMGPLPVVGVAFILVVVVCVLLAPALAPYSPSDAVLEERLLPVGTAGHLLGTDGLGRDILSRMIWGSRPTLLAGLVPVIVGGILGTSIGVLAGLAGRLVNSIIMRLLDIMYAFPAVLLAIAISSALGPGLVNSMIAMSVVLTPSVARVAESEVRRMRGADYMLSARTTGARMPRIALVQVIPVIAPPLIVYLTAAVGLAVVYSAGLSFLGLGVVPPQPEWGVMVNELQQNLYSVPALLVAPALAIFLLAASFNVLGDGLQRLLNVRLEEKGH